MIKEIKYGGCTATPSDYDSPDGELAAVTNLIPEDNSLKPMLPPTGLFEVPAPHKVLYIHAPSTGVKHFIILDTDTNTLKWLDNSIVTEAQELPVSSEDVEDNLTDLHTFTGADIYSVNGIGNTIVVLTSDGIHYLLWKGSDTGYKYLGTHFPELPISFGLQGEAVRGDLFRLEGLEASNFRLDLSENDQVKATEQIMAKVNKFIADNSTNVGKFMFPFVVRYAYRLYDQTLTMHSAPVVMYCADGNVPFVNAARRMGVSYSTVGTYSPNYITFIRDMRVYGISHSLDYKIEDSNTLEMLEEWSDIIKSVDVFISKPIYTHNQNGKITNLCGKYIGSSTTDDKTSTSPYNDESNWQNNVNVSKTLCKHTNSDAGGNLQYKRQGASSIYQQTFVRSDGYPDGEVNDFDVLAGEVDASYDQATVVMNAFKYGVPLPERSKTDVIEEIRNVSQFYLLKSIRIDELATTRTKIDVPVDYLQSLVNREAMTDDYDSHDKLIPKYSLAYNSRINLANINKAPYDKFNPLALFQYCNDHIATVDADLFVYIKENGDDIVIKGQTAGVSGYGFFSYLFYPNVSAYKAVLKVGSSYYEYELKPHEMLNGAVAFASWDNPATITPATPPQETPAAERIYNVPNKVYTSEVNNPFLFTVKGINTVGTGTIVGVSVATKALSQGQFGQFPLYIFSTDGVWAMELNKEGNFVGCNPIPRDVCTAPESITQLDAYVNFATDRGIMMLEGSKSICISDEINNDNTIQFSGQPITIELPEVLPFRQFLTQDEGCRMLYDYIHQRVILYNAACNYAYVYSLKDKKWGMMENKLLYHLNAYPEALAVIRENGQDILVNMSEEDVASLTDPVTGEINGVQATLLTRPLKLDLPDGLKTVDTIIQRGMFDYADKTRAQKPVQQILYGSRDLYNWHLVWSSKDQYLRGFRGTPYKYFRLALICDLRPDEFLTGCTVQYTPRYTNQPR